MFKNIKNYFEFRRRVETLWADDFAERELEDLPSRMTGAFFSCRAADILKLARRHPEYHIVSCIEPELFINTFVNGAMSYYLAEGDADPYLVHDPFHKLDAHLIYSLMSRTTSKVSDARGTKGKNAQRPRDP